MACLGCGDAVFVYPSQEAPRRARHLISYARTDGGGYPKLEIKFMDLGAQASVRAAFSAHVRHA